MKEAHCKVRKPWAQGGRSAACRKESAPNISLELHRAAETRAEKRQALLAEGTGPVRGYRKRGKLQRNWRNLQIFMGVPFTNRKSGRFYRAQANFFG